VIPTLGQIQLARCAASTHFASAIIDYWIEINPLATAGVDVLLDTEAPPFGQFVNINAAVMPFFNIKAITERTRFIAILKQFLWLNGGGTMTMRVGEHRHASDSTRMPSTCNGGYIKIGVGGLETNPRVIRTAVVHAAINSV